MQLLKYIVLFCLLQGISHSVAQRSFTVDSDFPLEVVSQDFTVPYGVGYEPDETVEVKVSLKNQNASSVDLSGARWKVARSREKMSGLSGLSIFWEPLYTYHETLTEGKLKQRERLLKKNKATELSVRFTPGSYGYFAVLFQLNPEAKWQHLTGVAIVRKPAEGKRLNTPFLGEIRHQDFELDEANMDIAGRLGIKMVRTHMEPGIDREKGIYDFSKSDKMAEAARRSDVLLSAQLSSPSHATRCFSTPRIAEKPLAYRKIRADRIQGRTDFKVSMVVPPEQLEPVGEFGTWADWVYQTVKRYKDVYVAGQSRNEPWEGGGISHWGASGKYLRELDRVASQSAKKANPGFLFQGVDSRTNFEDNVQMTAGQTQYYDIMTVHNYGQGFKDNTALAQAKRLGKEVWETENWGPTDDSFTVISSTIKYASGLKKMAPLVRTHAMSAKNAQGKIAAPRPIGQAVSTWLHFVEDTAPYAELHKDVLPWVFLFKSTDAKAPQRHVGIVFGRAKIYGAPYVEGEGDASFKTFHADGKLFVEDKTEDLTVFNIEGNVVDFRNANGTHVIPMAEEPYYIRSRQGIADLETKLKTAQARYDEPGLQLVMHDLDDTADKVKEIKVALTNRVLSDETVKLKLEAPSGWRLESDTLDLGTLEPGESRKVTFKVAQATESKQNRYPFTLLAKTGQGVAQLSEELRVATFKKGSVKVDGDLSDWKQSGVIPVSLGGGKTSVSAADNLLFQDFSAAEIKGEISSSFVGMWDENYFYFAAKVSDDSESIRHSMVSGFTHIMHSEFDYLYWHKPQHPSMFGDVFKIMFDVHRAGEKNDPWIAPEDQKLVDDRFIHLSVDYEYDFYLARATELAKPYAQVLADHVRQVQAGKGPYGNLRPPFEKPTFKNIGEPFAEAWRLMAPGVPRHNYYPFSDRLERDQGVVPEAKLVVRRLKNSIIYEGAIPWSELAEVPHRSGEKVRFNWAVLNDGKYALEWAKGRSIGKGKAQIAHPTWNLINAVETEWTFRE